MNWMKSCALAVAVCTLGASNLSNRALATDTSYYAFGYGCKVDTSLTGLVFLGHSGIVGPNGGARSKSALDATLLGVAKVRVMHGSACAAHDQSQALAGAAGVHVFPLLPYALDCDVATSEARVSGTGSWGRSYLLNLRLGGVPITVTGAPNQRIAVDGLFKLVINEQKLVHVGDSRTMRVNALRLTVNGVGEVVVAAAEADINFVPNSGHGNCIDFLSGCGRLTDGQGHLLDFSINIGINADLSFCSKTGCFSNGAKKIVLLGCTKYRKSGSGQRHCEGPCSINGVTGFTYILDCLDGGDSAINDLCSLKLSDGSSFSGHCSIGQIRLNIPCGSLALIL